MEKNAKRMPHERICQRVGHGAMRQGPTIEESEELDRWVRGGSLRAAQDGAAGAGSAAACHVGLLPPGRPLGMTLLSGRQGPPRPLQRRPRGPALPHQSLAAPVAADAQVTRLRAAFGVRGALEARLHHGSILGAWSDREDPRHEYGASLSVQGGPCGGFPCGTARSNDSTAPTPRLPELGSPDTTHRSSRALRADPALPCRACQACLPSSPRPVATSTTQSRPAAARGLLLHASSVPLLFPVPSTEGKPCSF